MTNGERVSDVLPVVEMRLARACSGDEMVSWRAGSTMTLDVTPAFSPKRLAQRPWHSLEFLGQDMAHPTLDTC
jgi:hypothetical protein